MAEAETSSWQTQFSTLRERVEYAFKNSHFSDIEFTIDDGNGEKVTLSASKHILSISSPVFEAMFHGKLAEKGPTIDLPDCTKDGLQEMLRFLHSDDINLTGNNVMEVLYLADKYTLPFLEKKCYEYISNDLTPTDVFTVLSQATQCNNSRVEELCWDIVDLKTHQAVTSDAFLNISHDLLKKVLERETLQTDEINLFKAVNAWASNQVQDQSKKKDGEAKRDVLGDEIIHLIRFPVMTQKEFAGDVLVSDLLCPNEAKEIMQVFSSVAPPQKLFKGVKRKGQWCERWTECRFTTIGSKQCSFYSKEEDCHTVMFSVNKPIFLAGFHMFASRLKIEYTIACEILIRNANCENELFKETLFLDNDDLEKMSDTHCVYSLEVNPPVLLLPKEQYSIKAIWRVRYKQVDKRNTNFHGSWSPCLGEDGKSVIKCEDIIITFSEGKEGYGQFPSFLLKRKVELKKRQKTNVE